jgi:hypothetical protein
MVSDLPEAQIKLTIFFFQKGLSQEKVYVAEI